MSGPAWVRWYPDDWASSVRVGALSMAERGLYRELLDLQARTGGPFSWEPTRIARLIRCDLAELEALWPAVRSLFAEAGGLYGNPKMQEQIEHALSSIDGNLRGGLERASTASRDGTGRFQSRSPGRDLARSRSRSPSRSRSRSNPAPQNSELRTQNQNTEPEKNPPPSGGPATPQAAFVEWFGREFSRSRGCQDFTPARKDFVAAAALLKAHDEIEIMRRAEIMLGKVGDWWAENASLTVLLSKWNGLAEASHNGHVGKKSIAQQAAELYGIKD